MTRDAVPHGPTSPLGDEQPRTGTSGARGYAERQIAAESRAAGPTEGEIEAAARALGDPFGQAPPSYRPSVTTRIDADRALAAALPLIEARLTAPVRALHKPGANRVDGFRWCSHCVKPWPCPTIRALDDPPTKETR